ncbi:hypothetical protein RYX36_006128 [Vicia faba]
MSSWGMFGSKFEDAADLFDKSANSYKLSKSCKISSSSLIDDQLHLESKHEAASAYVDAAHCYKKVNMNEVVSCLDNAVNIFCDIGRISMAAGYLKEIVELCESGQNIEKALVYYEKSADFYESEEDVAAAIDEEDVAKFTEAVKEFDSMTPLAHAKFLWSILVSMGDFQQNIMLEFFGYPCTYEQLLMGVLTVGEIVSH